MEGDSEPGAWNFGGAERQGRKVLCCGFLRSQEQKSAGGALQGDGAFDGKTVFTVWTAIFSWRNTMECADDVQLDDNTLIKQIQQDVRTKDMLSLSEHVDRLFHNYQTERRIFPDLCEIRLFQPVEGFI